MKNAMNESRKAVIDKVMGKPLPKFGQWLPITDAPKDGTVVDLVLTNGQSRRREMDAQWEYFMGDPKKEKLWVNGSGWPVEKGAWIATHFMLMPSLPRSYPMNSSFDELFKNAQASSLYVNQRPSNADIYPCL